MLSKMKRKSQSLSSHNSKDILDFGYDSVRWDLLGELFQDKPLTSIPDCKYRYDSNQKVIYSLSEKENATYTYIAKADGLDIYKIGHTTNLSRRMRELSSKKPYSYLRLKAIAYSCYDIEKALLLSIKDTSKCLPAPYDKVEELVVLKLNDVLKIIKRGHFISLDDPKRLPGQLTQICRTEYDPDDGHCIGRHKGFNVKFDDV